MTGCYGEFLRYAEIARKANIHSTYPLRQYHPFLPASRGRKLGEKSRQRKISVQMTKPHNGRRNGRSLVRRPPKVSSA